MKKLLFLVFIIACSHLDEPEGKSVTDNFVDHWWEFDVFGYNACFKLQEEEDEKLLKSPFFLKEIDDEEEELFGTWTFEPPNTFYVYEDGEKPPYEVDVFEDGDCWTIEWVEMTEIACPCSF